MLKLSIAQTFCLLIQVTMPSSDPRKPTTGHFTASYKSMDREQLKSLARDVESGLSDDEHLDRILAEGDAIGQIGDEQGNLLPPATQREMVYKHLALAKAALAAFYAEVGGHLGKTSLQSRVR